jgi:hypothetical protein
LIEKEKIQKESLLAKRNRRWVWIYRDRKSLSDYYWYVLDRFLFEKTIPLYLGAGKKACRPFFREDTFPTYHRANTRGQLIRKTRRTGLKEAYFIYASDLSFFIFNRILFGLWLLLVRLTDNAFWKPLRMHFGQSIAKVARF